MVLNVSFGLFCVVLLPCFLYFFFFSPGSVGLILCFIPSMALKFVFLIVRHLLPEQYLDV